MDPEDYFKLVALFDQKIDKIESRHVKKVIEAVSENVSGKVAKIVDKKVENLVKHLSQRQGEFESTLGDMSPRKELNVKES
jgi:hypothetical protein